MASRFIREVDLRRNSNNIEYSAFATTFAEASVVKEGYGGHGEIAQLVRAHDS